MKMRVIFGGWGVQEGLTYFVHTSTEKVPTNPYFECWLTPRPESRLGRESDPFDR
jgi:hypothetical protein